MDRIKVKPLKILSLKDGDLFKMIDRNCSEFSDFGEIYFSKINHRAVKAWKKHKEMTLNLAVPVGAVRFIFFDDRNKSEVSIQEIVVGELDYKLITVPPGIWFGFQGLSLSTSLVANCASIVHSDPEVERISHEDARFIPFSWEKA